MAKDFTRFPAGRYVSDGKYSGERFREEHLSPALKENSTVTVSLDGTMGFGSSFLEEAFGGLVRRSGFTALEMESRLVLEARDQSVIDEIWEYISG